MLENTEGAIKNGQSRETGNIRYTRGRQTDKNTTQYMLDTTICKQTQVNKTWALVQRWTEHVILGKKTNTTL